MGDWACVKLKYPTSSRLYITRTAGVRRCQHSRGHRRERTVSPEVCKCSIGQIARLCPSNDLWGLAVIPDRQMYRFPTRVKSCLAKTRTWWGQIHFGTFNSISRVWTFQNDVIKDECICSSASIDQARHSPRRRFPGERHASCNPKHRIPQSSSPG